MKPSTSHQPSRFLTRPSLFTHARRALFFAVAALTSSFGDTLISDSFDRAKPGTTPTAPDIGTYEQITGAVTVEEVSAGDHRLQLAGDSRTGATVVYRPTEEVNDFTIDFLFHVEPKSEPSGSNAFSQQLIFLPGGTNFNLFWSDDSLLYTRYTVGGRPSTLTSTDVKWSPGEDYRVRIQFDPSASAYTLSINEKAVIDGEKIPFDYTALRALAFSVNLATSGACLVDDVTMTSPESTECLDRSLRLQGEHSIAHYPFNVLTPGKIIADLSWTGKSPQLRVSLHGRQQPGAADPLAPYEQVAGASPLQLVYEVTQADIDRGTHWRLVVDDPTDTNDAAISLKLTLPFDADLSKNFNREKISLRSGDFLPTPALQTGFFKELAAAKTGLHALIVISRTLTCDQIDLLERKGVIRQSYLSSRQALGLVKAGVDPADPAIAPLVKWILPLEPQDKIEPDVLFGNFAKFELREGGKPLGINTALNPDGTLRLLVQFYPDVEVDTIQAILKRLARDFSAKSDTLWEVTLPADAVLALAENDQVEWIEGGPLPILPENDVTRTTINVDTVQNAALGAGNTISYNGLSGAGITIGIHDNGVDASHNDLNVVRDVSGAGDHGTHVAGIAAGSGIQSALNNNNGASNGGTAFQWRGMAPSAGIVDWGNLVHAGNTLDAITNDSMDVVNHSNALDTDGNYSSDNRLIDQLIRGGATSGGTLVPRIGRSYSAGNAGGNSAQYGNQFGYFATTKQMKNAVVVGNWNAGTGFLSAGSSMGPAYDGRIMPDVVAPGSNITSTNQLNGYRTTGGTSMAAPVVAGLHALLLEGWQNTYSTPLGVSIDSNPPLPSTIRAILIQTATDIVSNDVRNGAHVEVDSDSNPANGNDGSGNPTATAGPDFTTGWGLVNAQAAVDLMQDFRTVDGVPVPNQIIQDTVNQASVREYSFIVDAPGAVQITLAWDDIEAAAQSPAVTPRLINDLDLELVSPTGTVFYPWQLGQTILDEDGDPIADADQSPGTAIQVQIPVSPTTTPASNNDYIPANVLTGAGAWVATTGRDHLNNVEQVRIANAPAGRWTARVIGFDLPTGAQDFSLVGLPYPDLPELLGSNESKVGIGGFNEDITVQWTVTNAGPVATGGPFNYQIRLSTDFFLGSDIILPIQSDNQPSDGVLANLGAGASRDVTTTFRITSAQASSLLGIPAGSITVQDLIDNDVFILVYFDSGDAILEHDEGNLIPVQASRLIDVALVMDRSGSMGSTVPVSNGSQTKLEQLKKAANLFLDLMRTNNGDRLGEVSFASTVAVDFDEPGVLQQVTEFTSGSGGSIADAKQAVDNLSAGGGTNIRDALQTGLDLIPAGGDRRKVIVFLSDGMKTAGGNPQDPTFLQQFSDQSVNVFSVGFGTEGGSGCSGLDVDLLSSLANTGPDGFFQVAESATQLDKFFINALGGAIESELIVDPEGTLAPGQTLLVDAGLGHHDRSITFVLTWDDPAANLLFYLRSPSGLQIYPGNVANFAESVVYVKEAGYAFYKVNPPLPAGPDIDHGGSWEMVIQNQGAQSTRYLANVLADSTIDLTLAAPPPAGSTSHETGQPINLNATFSHSGGSPLTSAVLTVYPSVPTAGLGDVFSSKLVDRSDLEDVPAEMNGETLSLLERMGMAFEMKYGRPPLTKNAAAPFTLPLVGQAGSTALFSESFATSTPGEYCFLLTAEALDDNCHPVEREILRFIRVKPAIDPAVTRIDLTPHDTGIKVTVIPRDRKGHFIGPGYAEQVSTVSDGFHQSGPVVDNLDGSYCIFLEGGPSGVIQVTFSGVALPPIRVESDVPTPAVIVPSGGTNDTPTTVVIGTQGSGGAVTGVALTNNGVQVSLTNINVNPRTGEVTAVVPAGLDPGNYRLVLMRDNKTSLPSLTTFKVVGRGATFPDITTALGEQLEGLFAATSDKEGLAILENMLLTIRNAPLGTAFTEEDQKHALKEISELLYRRQGLVEKSLIPHLLAAYDLSKIDARDLTRGDVPTPPGDQVEVELNYQVKLKFDNVIQEGKSQLRLFAGPEAFRNGSLGRVPAIFDITSTADFGDKGIVIEIQYEEGDYDNESALILAHRKNGLWINITSEIDPATNTIRGRTQSLSDFAVFELLPDQEVGEITGEQNDNGQIEVLTPDGRFYDIQFSDDLVTWKTIAEGVSGTFVDTDPDRLASPRQFYQAILNKP